MTPTPQRIAQAIRKDFHAYSWAWDATPPSKENDFDLMVDGVSVSGEYTVEIESEDCVSDAGFNHTLYEVSTYTITSLWIGDDEATEDELNQVNQIFKQ